MLSNGMCTIHELKAFSVIGQKKNLLISKDKASIQYNLEATSVESNELYDHFEKFLKLLSPQSSFVRVRGFCLCCA